jgi:hypothetical protein
LCAGQAPRPKSHGPDPQPIAAARALAGGEQAEKVAKIESQIGLKPFISGRKQLLKQW